MSIIGDFWRGLERRNLPLDDPTAWRAIGYQGGRTNAGVNVTPENSLKYAAVLACVRVLAESVASLPLITYERPPGGRGRQRAQAFYLYSLLHDAPNRLLTSFEWREMQMAHLLLWGNAYSEIEYNRRGEVVALWPLLPNMMHEVRMVAGRLEYVYHVPPDYLNPHQAGRIVTLQGDQVLHIRGLSLNGLVGLSPIGMARQAIGLGVAAEVFGAKFFGSGANMSGVLTHPGVLGDEAFANLREQWEETYSGLSNAQRVAILEEGMRYERIGVPPEDAQFLQTRKFQRSEIASIYRVPPHMIADLERATFSNIEHQSLEFVMHSLRPWLVRWEQSIGLRLLTTIERRRYFAEFLVDGLLRGDSASRSAYYTAMFQIGAMSPNDIRELENQNPVPGGDTHFVQLNMVPVEAATNPAEPPAEPEPEPPAERSALPAGTPPPLEARALRSVTMRHRLQRAQLPVFRDVAGRVLRREANDVVNAARRLLQQRSVPEFSAWLDEFYADHAEFTARQWFPVLLAYAGMIQAELENEIPGAADVDNARIEAFANAYAMRLGRRQAGRTRARLDRLLTEFGVDALVRIEALADEWREQRPAGVASEETVRSGGAFALMLYGAAGVTALRWASIGKTCPYCTRMDGRVVGINRPFAAAGEAIGADAPDGPLQVTRNVKHPPIHRGCDCLIVAG